VGRYRNGGDVDAESVPARIGPFDESHGLRDLQQLTRLARSARDVELRERVTPASINNVTLRE
jgi:hypothetical protein